jgi:hypothetical protein
VSSVKRHFEAVEEQTTSSGASNAEKRIRRKSVPPVTGSMLRDSSAGHSDHRRSLAESLSQLDQQVSPTKPEPSPELVPVAFSRPKKKTFEAADVKDRGVKTRGPIGRLRSLIERFERL